MKVQSNKVIGRQELTNNVHTRLDGGLSKLVLYEALQVICEDLSKQIADGQSVSINNFGTFYSYEFGSRKNVDISSGELRETNPFINIAFMPEKAFSDLIKQRKSFFK